MKAKFILISLFLGIVYYSEGQITGVKHELVSFSFSEAYYQDGVNNVSLSKLRPYAGLNIHPLKWLSVGYYFSYKENRKGSITPTKYRTSGGRLAFHLSPVFDSFQYKYLKDHLDIYIAGLVQEDYSEYHTYKRRDPITGELQDPFVFKQRFINSGFSVGLSYYIIENAGLNFEYARTGKHMAKMNIYKTGIVIRF